MVTAPPANVVIGTETELVNALNVTVGGTVALLVSLELRFTTTPPAGAGADRFNSRFVVELDKTSNGSVKLRVPVTCTDLVSLVKPDADAVMLAVPKLTPVT